MESESNFEGRFKLNSRGLSKAFFNRGAAQVELITDHSLPKGSPKDKKDGKITQEKKNVTINVNLLKAAFFALGQFGPGDVEEDPRNEQVNLSFSDLSYSIKQGMRREAKLILNNLHGEFRAGELTAVVGPSGSGKTSLLNILAGFTTTGVTGSVRINDKERDLTTFASRSCYIMQNDELSPLLTAEEAITMAANLKLGSKASGETKTVMKILQSLGLSECRQVLTQKLSGGQRKRLAIALELVSNPPVIFLDEPTSGLDGSSSKQCVTLLKELAETGRTVVSILHQPSASLFEMFDHLYVMREGSCMYAGDATKLLPFLAEYGLQCPFYHNPADFILEVATMAEYGEQVPKLIDRIKNGKCPDWRKMSTESAATNCHSREQFAKNDGDASVPVEETSCPLVSSEEKPVGSPVTRHVYPTSFWTQFHVILSKNLKKISRNLFFAHLQLLAHVVCGILIGSLFYDIGNDATFVMDNFGFHFFCLMWNMFTSYSSAVSFYPQERRILIREHFNKWYSLKAYFLATNLANLPLQILCTMTFTTISYFMTSQPAELERFLKFCSIVLLVALVGQGFGYVVGSAMNVQNAAIFGALLIAPFLLFSGYFVLLADSPTSLQWLFHISYYKYALEGVMNAVFGSNRRNMKCSGDYCHYKVPKKFLKRLSMDNVDYWLDFSVLFVLSIFLREYQATPRTNAKSTLLGQSHCGTAEST